MESEQFSLSWNNFHSNLSAGFHSLLEDEDLVDVTLTAEGQYLKAHKTILSVCSPYFKELFKMNPCKHPIVILQDVNYTALKNLLQFMYYGEVSVSEEEIPLFMRAAETLKVKGLTDTGSNGFLERMTEHNKEARPAGKHQKPSKKAIKHVQSRSTESPHSSYSSHPSESPRLVKSPEPTPAKRICTEETNSEIKATVNPKEEPAERNEEYADLSYDDSLDMSSMLNTSITENPRPSGSWVQPNQTQTTTDTSSPGGLLFMKSRRGHPVVIHNGHIYTLYQKYESRTTWQCVKRRVYNCTGCIITTDGPMVLSYSGHNHPQLNDVIQRLHAPACSSSLLP